MESFSGQVANNLLLQTVMIIHYILIYMCNLIEK